MKRYTPALWISAVMCLPVQAQHPPELLAHFSVAASAAWQQPDVFSVLQQPASLAGIEMAQTGMTGIHPYNLPELGAYQVLLALPAGPGAFAFQAGMYGKGAYSDNRITTGYGRRLTNRIRAGLLFHYSRVQFAGYEKSSAVSASAGLQTRLSETLTLSLSVENPAALVLDQKSWIHLPLRFSWGIGFAPSRSVLFSLLVQKPEHQPASALFSFIYKPVPPVLIRAGVETGQGHCWTGVGYQLGRMRLDLGAAWHPRLGISPVMQALFNLKNEKP